MKSIKTFWALIFIFWVNGVSADDNIAKAIKTAVIANMKFLEQENAEKAMSTVHRQSLSYATTNSILPNLFKAYDLTYTLKSFQFIKYDGELAYVRVKQITRRTSGAPFRDNEIDTLQIFKQENNEWKLWSQANMQITYL